MFGLSLKNEMGKVCSLSVYHAQEGEGFREMIYMTLATSKTLKATSHNHFDISYFRLN